MILAHDPARRATFLTAVQASLLVLRPVFAFVQGLSALAGWLPRSSGASPSVPTRPRVDDRIERGPGAVRTGFGARLTENRN